ncbi:MAG TPA: histidine kinase [Chitinophagaceae bacterium]|nr:histidine kinase [Chitinophagaceae bacterium]
MSTYSLIFSNNKSNRIARHALFWLSWILYYTIFSTIIWHSSYPSYPVTKVFFSSLTEVGTSTPLDMAFCYSIIYFLFPRFLHNGRYISMVLLWLVFSVLFIFLFEVFQRTVVPVFRDLYGMPQSPPPKSYLYVFFNLFSQINMEGCLAAAIKLGKLWYIKQQELDLIKTEKRKIEPLIEEGQIQPVFFADILNRIEVLLTEKPLLVAGMIKKIKSLLLYAMYENNQSKVSLDKELELLQEYVDLEKMALENKVSIILKINSQGQAEQVAPFIILPITENAFKQLSLHAIERKSVEIDIKVTNGLFVMTLTWSKPGDTSTLYTGRGIILQNISRRLNLIYPQSHELKVFIQVEHVVVSLKIDLHKAINK